MVVCFLTFFAAVYLLKCSRCQRSQYVGQTKRPLRERVAGHRAAFESKKNMPLYRHLHRSGHSFSNARFTILERVQNPEDLLEREKHWIRKLQTVIPWGLNSKWSLTGNREEGEEREERETEQSPPINSFTSPH